MSIQTQIQSKISTLSSYERFLSRKEIKELPLILWENEVVENIIVGRYYSSIGLLTATNKRLIFLDKGLFKLKVEDFDYSKISSILYSTGIFTGKMIIFSSGNKSIIHDVRNAKLRVFGDWVRAKISQASNNIITSSQGNPISKIEQLERLAKLKDQGILNEIEFNIEKVKILNP